MADDFEKMEECIRIPAVEKHMYLQCIILQGLNNNGNQQTQAWLMMAGDYVQLEERRMWPSLKSF